MSHCTLTINISEQYQIQCIITDEKEIEYIIKLNYQNDDSCQKNVYKNSNNISSDYNDYSYRK